MARRGWAWGLASGAALLFGGLNLLARQQARALTTYHPVGDAPIQLESLSWMDRLGLALRGPTLARPRAQRSPLDVGLSFRTETVQTADGLSLEGWVIPREGARGEIVLVPGYLAARDALLEAAVRLHARGWRVSLMSPRGTDGSGGDRTTLGWKESLDVAAFAAQAKGRSTGPVVLYGYSQGGAAVLRALARGEAQADAAIVEATFGSLRQAIAARSRHLGMPATPAVDLLLFWAWVDQGVPGWDLVPSEDAADLRVPLLVLQGADDWRAPPEAGQAIAQAAARGRYAEIDGLGHQPGAEARPLAWERAVEGFLQEEYGRPDAP